MEERTGSSGVQEQIHQMTKFIENEAREKIREIQVMGAENAEILRAKILSEKKKIIDTNFDEKLKQIETRKRIEVSNLHNLNKLELLKQQTDFIFTDIRSRVREEIQRLVDDRALLESSGPAKYEEMCTKMILEGVYGIYEPEIVVQSLERDLELVKRAAEQATALYHEESKSHAAAKRLSSLKIVVLDETNRGQYGWAFGSTAFLSPDDTLGGVRIASPSNAVYIANTLDARMEEAFTKLLPHIKTLLFGPSEARVYMS